MAGLSFDIDANALKKEHLVLDLNWPKPDGNEIRLRIQFSEFHPYFRPVVQAPDSTLKRHQDPFEMNLCLIGQETELWDPHQRVYEYLSVQMPRLFAALEGSTSGNCVEHEEQLPDPFSAHFAAFCEPRSVLFVYGAWPLPEGERFGMFDATIEQHPNGLQSTLRGYIWRLCGNRGNEIRSWRAPATSSEKIQGRWIYLDEPIVESDPVRFAERVDEAFKKSGGSLGLPRQKGRHDLPPLQLTAVLFPEEVRYREMGLGWQIIAARRPNPKRSNISRSFIRTMRAAPSDIYERLPAASALREKTVAIVGVGAIGAPVALELARAGVKRLVLVDGDRVDPGMSVRWPLGMGACGLMKVEALDSFIRNERPWTAVEMIPGNIGATAPPKNQANNVNIIRRALADVDVIFDGTAEFGVHHYLSHTARRLERPYVYAHGTFGAWGGVVAHFGTNGPCWECLERHIKDKHVPMPPEDPAGNINPTGCSKPTFTGGGFDLGEISLEAVRTIIDILSRAGDDQSGKCGVSVLSLRDSAGGRVLPTWQPWQLIVHDGCGGTH